MIQPSAVKVVGSAEIPMLCIWCNYSEFKEYSSDKYDSKGRQTFLYRQITPIYCYNDSGTQNIRIGL